MTQPGLLTFLIWIFRGQRRLWAEVPFLLLVQDNGTSGKSSLCKVCSSPKSSAEIYSFPGLISLVSCFLVFSDSFLNFRLDSPWILPWVLLDCRYWVLGLDIIRNVCQTQRKLSRRNQLMQRRSGNANSMGRQGKKWFQVKTQESRR